MVAHIISHASVKVNFVAEVIRVSFVRTLAFWVHDLMRSRVLHDIDENKLALTFMLKRVFSRYVREICTNKQYVQINCIDSSLMTISCGVPQGSILGPLLFLIYLNDLRYAAPNSIVHHFADDTNLIISNKSLESLYNWLCANRLSLNVAKTEFLLFRNNLSENRNFNFTLRLNNKTLHESHRIKY